MPDKPIAKTGQPVPVSGIYRPSGGRYEVTLAKGEKTPPNNEGVRQQFTLVRKTRHKAD